MAKRRRAPEVLWKLFHKRARSLAETIVSLIPPPTSSVVVDCRLCKGRKCLGCCAQADRMTFLVRETDSSDYRKLLTRCFMVVSDNAPPVSAYYPDCRWSQLEIVRRTMEIILCEQPKSTNLICSGYDKYNRSSDISELLTCSSWCLLLERVGDALMVYLLKYTSIFLPLPREKYHQVAGFPISNLCYNLLKHRSESTCQDLSSDLGSKKRQKRISKIESTSGSHQFSSSFGADIPSRSVGCLGCKPKSDSSKLCMKKCFEKKINDVDTNSTGAEAASVKGISGGVSEESLSQTLTKSRKRSRCYKGQHKSKLRLCTSHESSCLTSCPCNLSNLKNCTQKKVQVDDTRSSGVENATHEEVMSGVCHDPSRQALGKSRKRLRFFSGQRESKRKQFASQRPSCLTPCPTNLSNEDTLAVRHGYYNNTNFNLDHEKKKIQVDDTCSSGVENDTHEALRGSCHDSSRQALGKSRKRLRSFTGLHESKRKLLSSQTAYHLTPCPPNLSNEDTLTGRHAYYNDTNVNLRHDKCSCCNILQTLQIGSRDLQIDRQSMFYKMEHSKLAFPRTHIINSLKPNLAGATALFNDIFGTEATISAQSIPCFHRDNRCLLRSTCIYHSLIRQLKILLHKARGCRHLTLLDKHCDVPCLDQNSNRIGVSMFEENECQINACVRQCVGLKGEDQQQREDYRPLDPELHEISPNTAAVGPVQLYSSKAKVVSFIWAVCRNIVPSDLLGTSHNWRILRRNISKFISLRRFEKFSLKQCMHKLKKSKFPFLSNKHSSCSLNNHVLGNLKGTNVSTKEELSGGENGTDIIRQKLLDCWIYWLFSCLVRPLLQANFYVTESEYGKQEVFYYQKSIWKKLSISFLKDQNYHLLNEASVRKVLTNRTFGFSRVRLRPKGNGIRPLANLGAPSKFPVRKSWTMQGGQMKKSSSLHPERIQYEHFKSVNEVLRDLHVILKDVQFKRPEKLGSSVFDYNDVYRTLRPFISDLKKGLSVVPYLYIVVADVSKAFDSVNHEKLLSVMEDIILNDDYLLQKSQQVVSTKKNLKVCHNLILANDNRGSLSTTLTSSLLARSSRSIFVKQEWSRTVTKEYLHHNLLEHVKRNVLQVDKQFYLQNVGIPQGSILSPLLFSLYYGHLENSIIFPFLDKFSEHGEEDIDRKLYDGGASASLNSREDKVFSLPQYTLLRLVDDFLFISTSRKQANSFFLRLRRGFREYNCDMNEQKFGANFDLHQTPGFQSSRIYVGEDGNSFLRWSGLFINCKTFEIQADYIRYQDTHLSSTLTVSWNNNPVCQLKTKLCDYLRPKCHPIFYDSNINSPMVVRLNIYQAFLVCAMKFHCYVHDISGISKINSKSYMDGIHRSLRYMNKLIKKRMHSMNIDRKFRPLLQVGKGEIEWLGLNAYIRVLERKQSRYKELLYLLKLMLKASKTENVSSVLEAAIDDSHSSVIWKIKY